MGIKDGDIVRVYNERGAVLAGAYVAERIMDGAVSMDHGARYDPIVPGEFDRGGAINTITPHNRHFEECDRHGLLQLPGRGGEGDRGHDG